MTINSQLSYIEKNSTVNLFNHIWCTFLGQPNYSSKIYELLCQRVTWFVIRRSKGKSKIDGVCLNQPKERFIFFHDNIQTYIPK